MVYSDARLTRRSALVLIAGTAALSVETDAARQKAMIAEMNDFVLDESWVFPISSQPSILMSTNKLQGVLPTMHNGYYYDAAWFTS